MPSVTTTLQGASAWFNPLFDEFFPLALIGLGIGVLVLVLKWVSGGFGHHNH